MGYHPLVAVRADTGEVLHSRMRSGSSQRGHDRFVRETLARVQLIWGEQERAVPLETGLAAHRLIEGSELALIDSASHAPCFERPEEFNRALLDFLTRNVRR